MPDCSPAQTAKRAMVTLSLVLSRKYDIPALPLNRDSPDKDVIECFRKVARKAHPDKGETDRQREGRRDGETERRRDEQTAD